jgi:leader peptidase (prepilin peptidase)/N-methyltransferase
MVFVYTLWGLLVGVLINHTANALLNQRSLRVAPRCAYCGEPHSPWAWSAVIGYIVARGHCHHCAAPLPLRAVLVELATALLFAFLWDRYGPSLQLGLLSLYSVILILVVVTDLERRRIYNAIMLPAIAVAAVGGLFNRDFSYIRAWLGGALGCGIIFAIYLLAALFARIVGRLRGQPLDEPAFGFGDVKLALFIGLVTGLPGVIFALILGILLGGIGALLYTLITTALSRRYTPFAVIPYGPFLAVGGFIVMIYGPQIIAWYVNL